MIMAMIMIIVIIILKSNETKHNYDNSNIINNEWEGEKNLNDITLIDNELGFIMILKEFFLKLSTHFSLITW